MAVTKKSLTGKTAKKAAAPRVSAKAGAKAGAKMVTASAIRSTRKTFN